MAASLANIGPRKISLTRDMKGHRLYRLMSLVKTSTNLDGPQVVMNTPGLPAIGSTYNFGFDVDVWAYCTPKMSVSPEGNRKGENTRYWKVEQEFTTIPMDRCQDTTIEDPLLEPPGVSGSFVKYLKKATKDRFGDRIETSAKEAIQNIEVDDNRPTVRISQNVPLLELDVFSQMVDTVNDDTLWGLEARRIKLSNVSWQRQYYGICSIYYSRIFDFEVRYDGFDFVVPDEGTMCLDGEWDLGFANNWGEVDEPELSETYNTYVPYGYLPGEAKVYVKFKDKSGNLASTPLDGAGAPAFPNAREPEWAGTGTGTLYDPEDLEFEYYKESNFLTLGIPTIL